MDLINVLHKNGGSRAKLMKKLHDTWRYQMIEVLRRVKRCTLQIQVAPDSFISWARVVYACVYLCEYMWLLRAILQASARTLKRIS